MRKIQTMEKVTFKSLPFYYEKEKSGIKNNTVRKADTSGRFFDLECFMKGLKELQIEIVNTETKESFIRKIIDVSYFDTDSGDEFYIITWEK